MKTDPEQMLDEALGRLRERAEPDWVRKAGQGLEARVRQRLLSPPNDLWSMAWNWPSLGFACSVTVAVCLWSGWGPVNLIRDGGGLGFRNWLGALTGEIGLFF